MTALLQNPLSEARGAGTGWKTRSGRGLRTTRTKPDRETTFLGLTAPLARGGGLLWPWQQRDPCWRGCRRGNLSFISLSYKQSQFVDQLSSWGRTESSLRPPAQQMEPGSHACQESNVPRAVACGWLVYFHLHCPDEETEASERLGNVPDDIRPGKDGKEFAVYPIASSPPLPPPDSLILCFYTTYHFRRLSCLVPVVPTRAGTLSNSLLHRAWHIVGPQ